ncbi:bifunctional phosphoglucose/phosphomannose isomerase [bacterium]|nr:bifunctional phosphoglucose/phosphomannose isomerase [bacterium]
MAKEPIDKSNIRKVILDFPKQFKEGIKRAENIKIEGKFDNLVVCGMGGSALPGDILKIWLKNYKIALPLIINRTYTLPEGDEHYLYVCISYSGNTEELLCNYKEAKKRKLPLVVITSGGKLAKLAKNDKVPTVIIPKGLPPRLALGYQFSALMEILFKANIIQNELKDILKIEKILNPKKLEKKGKEIAKKLRGKIPIVYTSDFWEPLARIWKISFCENSKVLSFHNYFPELSHNEIAGFWHIKERKITGFKVYLIILRDNKENPRILRQMKIVKELAKKEGIDGDFVEIKGENILEKVFSTLLLGFWTSYYLALFYKIDPGQVKIISEFKRKLSKNL